jgi:GAF domain
VLRTLTLTVNFLALAAALWLGLYVVTRNMRSLLAWLTGLTLWSMSGLFLNILLALNPPPAPADLPGWLLFLVPFWRPEVFETGANAWLQGWLVTPAVAFWHHATILMRPGRMNGWRWARVAAGYAGAAVAVGVQLLSPPMGAGLPGNPLYLDTLQPGPLFPLYAAWMLTFTLLSLSNLALSARAAPTALPRKQLITLGVATVAALSGPIAAVALALGLRVPWVALSLPLGASVVLIGYGVARYSTLMAGRVLRRDFLYNAVAVSLVTALYLAVTAFSVRAYRVPAAAFIFVLMLAVITHSLVDVARRTLDAVFYKGDATRLRANLRSLVGLIGEGEPLDDLLARSLESLCTLVRATYGLIVLFDNERVVVTAAHRRPETALPLTPARLAADDVRPLAPGTLPPPLAEAALLIPLYDESGQMGALLLGRPENGLHYSEADIETLLHPADRLANAIRNARREAEHLAALASLAEAQKAAAPAEPDQSSVKIVEDALRNLSSFAYLGEHPLTEWKLVTANLGTDGPTFLDRGKALYGILAEAVEKLRPAGRDPSDPPPREWYPYLILRDAYLEDVPNRDIMARLYISEGTFNRTRRAALKALARSLEEMEQALEV